MSLVVHVLPDHEGVSQAVAGRLTAFAREFPAGTYALPSGNTPLRLYELLAEAAKAEQVHFGWANVFALDEYVGLGPEDARSFAAFFRRHVFGPLGVAEGHGHLLDGLASDLAAEAERYEDAIAAAGGLNLTLLGLGANGHIAFNEPGASLQAYTHTAVLAAPASMVAPRGLTMGVGTLLAAPKVMLMASGVGKADAVAAMLSGKVDPHCPASVLQLHPNVDVFLDRAAASKL